MAKKKIVVDGKEYASRKVALKEFREACIACEGSEGQRMSFAYFAILDGYNTIDTYEETMSK